MADTDISIGETFESDPRACCEADDLSFRAKSSQSVWLLQQLIHNSFDLKAWDHGITISDSTVFNGSCNRYELSHPDAVKHIDLAVGSNLELVDHSICHVTHVIMNAGSDAILSVRGYLLSPINRLTPILRPLPNEVYWHSELVPNASGSSILEHVEIDLTRVIGERKVIFTNSSYPMYSQCFNKASSLNAPGVLPRGVLVCRGKYLKVFQKPNKRRVTRIEMQHLDLSDVQKFQSIKNSTSIRFWSNEKLRRACGHPAAKLGGSYPANAVDLTNEQPFGHGQSYTMIDTFSGPGGASCGARKAGVKVILACDRDPLATASYTAAFGDTRVSEKPIHQFLQQFDKESKNYPGDILHVSFPCQVYSPAHSNPGQDDDDNRAASYCIEEAIKVFKPRVVTIENTAGLFQRHRDEMFFIASQLTAHHYSIRFDLLQSADFGVPQHRERLIMICAGPGNPTPQLPKPTHSKQPEVDGLKPYNTIYSAIDRIPTYAENHTTRPFPFPKPPLDGNGLANCITTSGGDNYHPSGTRGYTPREFAVLQTFPVDHKFGKMVKMTKDGDGEDTVAYDANNNVIEEWICNTALKRQIGNAVPPDVMKAVCEEIVRCLWKSDYAEWRLKHPGRT